MFLFLLCVLLWALFANQAPFDTFGWLMIVAAAWFAGFMDARFLARWDRQPATPPGGDDPTHDAATFDVEK